MPDHVGIHIWDGSDYRKRVVHGGFVCIMAICGCETVTFEVVNPLDAWREDGHVTEVTCEECILLDFQRKAEECVED